MKGIGWGILAAVLAISSTVWAQSEPADVITGQISDIRLEAGNIVAFDLSLQGDGIVSVKARFFDAFEGDQLGVTDVLGDPSLDQQTIRFDMTLYPDVDEVFIRVIVEDANGEGYTFEEVFRLPEASPASGQNVSTGVQQWVADNEGLLGILLLAAFVLLVVLLLISASSRRKRPRQTAAPAPTTSGFTVFISYRRTSSAILANFLARELEKHGIDAFFDTRQTDGAGPFPDRLLREIEARDVFVVLLGAGTLDSEWVRREITHAHTLRKPMLPVFQEGYTPPAPPLSEPIAALLQYSGVHILDQRNLYIDQALHDIAAIIRVSGQSA